LTSDETASFSAGPDRELNAVYKESLSSDDPEHRKKAHEAQRAWLRYRDAFARLVVALQPTAATRNVRALLTEDRIVELTRDPIALDEAFSR
jgi:uncharacterized protein YecT (DUF1311 family)